MMAPAAPPTTAPMMAPRAVDPVLFPMTPPTVAPATVPMTAPFSLRLADAHAVDTSERATSTALPHTRAAVRAEFVVLIWCLVKRRCDEIRRPAYWPTPSGNVVRAVPNDGSVYERGATASAARPTGACGASGRRMSGARSRSRHDPTGT